MTDVTLNDARWGLEEAVSRGEKVTCPCCKQTVKVYSRPIHRGLWECLKLTAAAGDAGVTARELMRDHGDKYSTDYATLSYWSLIRQGEDGRWRLSRLGEEFLAGRISIAKYAFVRDGKVTGFSNKRVTADDCRKRFDLAEVMDPRNLSA